MFFDAFDIAVRSIVLLALAFAATVALTHWAVRSRRLNPFGAWPRLVRRVSDPILLPLERRVISAGGSPQNAPFWLLGLVIGGGLLLLSLTQWLIGTAAGLVLLAQGGVRVWMQVLISAIFTILKAAILIRVIGARGPSTSWMPIRRSWLSTVMTAGRGSRE